MGQLASGVAHNFNNSLAVILGRAELSGLLTEDPKLRRNLEIIEKAAHDGANTVKRLQDFARKREDRPTGTVGLNDIVSDVIEMTRPRWKDEAELLGVRLEVGFDARAEKDTVRGEGSELREILINLVHNALDAMPDGGRIAFATENAADEVIVSVTDSGIGMGPETRERALEPFFTTKGERGTGLGLSMVYGIVGRYGGQMEIESAPGKGTAVRLTLPAADEQARDLSTPRLITSASRRILIIEDEEEVTELVAEILQGGGHTAEFATDPRDGLDRFKNGTFDIVITDLSMPEMPGWLVAEEIRRLNPSVPLILLTGWGGQLDPERLKANHIDSVLSKPINRADILNSVERAFAD
ncbi:MAG: ATP-binding protein [Nitrospinota bacterium]|nr:ATP-binding protein [Nitrospinota bacterium]HJM42776.1 ATP-binding protein [Nitrospinota bacterium]